MVTNYDPIHLRRARTDDVFAGHQWGGQVNHSEGAQELHSPRLEDSHRQLLILHLEVPHLLDEPLTHLGLQWVQGDPETVRTPREEEQRGIRVLQQLTKEHLRRP